MKACRNKESKLDAFTLIELLVIIVVLGLLSCLLLPAFARAKPKSITAQCLGNKRQVQLAALMYATDNNDYLVPNSSAGAGGTTGWIPSGIATEDWFSSQANTNAALYQTPVLSPYLGYSVSAYRCPGDTIPSVNGLRIRSISMNSQVGGGEGSINYSPNFKLYSKVREVGTPSAIWVFCDESFWSLNDGFLQMNLTTPDYPDTPAAYHDRGNCFNFVDGHAEFRRWQWAGAGGPSGSPVGLRNVLYQPNLKANGVHCGSSPLDPDYQWLKAHAAEAN